jgi:2'-5' RNA ligase
MTSRRNVVSDERLRLFCALRLPTKAVDRLVAWQEQELSGGRIVPPENLHLTLAFLGSIPGTSVPAVVESLESAARLAKRPKLTVQRYHETQRVGMLVFDDDYDAKGLAVDLHRRLGGLGLYRPESRPWKPHVTVLRFRERPRLDPPLPGLGRVRLSEAAVYHSVLRPSGAQYEVLESVPLGG